MKVLTKILTRDDIDAESLIYLIKAGSRINVVTEDDTQLFSKPELVHCVRVYERVRDDDNTWQMSSWWENPDYEGDTTAKARADEYLVSAGHYPKVGTVLKTTTEVINEVVFDILGYHNGKITILVDVI